MYAETNAPMPMNAWCPSEICPAYPTSTLRLSAPMARMTPAAKLSLRNGLLANTYQSAIAVRPRTNPTRAARPPGVSLSRAGASRPSPSTLSESLTRSSVVATSRLLAEQSGGPHEQHADQDDEDRQVRGARDLVEVELGEGLHQPDEDAAEERAGYGRHPAENRRREGGDEHPRRAVAGGEARRERRQEHSREPTEQPRRAPRQHRD